MSQQSSWPVENHKGPHYTLTIFPGGKLVLTTPDTIDDDQLENVSIRMARWLKSTDDPLILGDCVVQMMVVAPGEVTVERSEV